MLISWTHVPKMRYTRYVFLSSLGCMRFAQFKRYDPSFMSRVLKEWHTYYRYKEGVSETDGDAVVRAHVAKNYSGWLYELRLRANRAIQSKPGTTTRDHQPEHIPDAT